MGKKTNITSYLLSWGCCYYLEKNSRQAVSAGCVIATPHIRESMPSMLGKDTWKAVDNTNLEWPFQLIPDEHLNLLPGLDCTVGLSSRAKYATQLGYSTYWLDYST